MSTYNELLDTARLNIENKKYDEAKTVYFEALKLAEKGEHKAIIWAEISWIFYRQQEFERTIEAINNVFSFDGNYQALQELYRLKAFAYLALLKDDEALEYLEKSIAIDRTSATQQMTLFELAKLYFRKAEFQKSHEIIEEIEAYFYQNNKDYWLSILFFYYYDKQLDSAEQSFETLLENAEEEKRRASALFGLAFIANEKQNYLNTINLCEAVLKADPEFYDKESLAFLTALSFYKLGRNDVFVQYYQELKKNYPKGRYEKELDAIFKEYEKKSASEAQKKQAKSN
jgi:tetratricopeptide (TPR) repeat protein